LMVHEEDDCRSQEKRQLHLHAACCMESEKWDSPNNKHSFI